MTRKGSYYGPENLGKLTIYCINMEFARNDRMFGYGVPARLPPLKGAPYSAGLQRTY